MIIRDTETHKIELVDNVIIKTFKRGYEKYNNDQLGNLWFEKWKDFKIKVPSIVDIFEVTSERIVMEYIEGEVTRFRYCTKTDLNNLLKYYYEIMTATLETCNEDGYYFLHEDMNAKNIINSQNKLRLIEPDAFRIVKNLDLSFFIMNQMRFSSRMLFV